MVKNNLFDILDIKVLNEGKKEEIVGVMSQERRDCWCHEPCKKVLELKQEETT
jgi:hypothetical protein